MRKDHAYFKVIEWYAARKIQGDVYETWTMDVVIDLKYINVVYLARSCLLFSPLAYKNVIVRR